MITRGALLDQLQAVSLLDAPRRAAIAGRDERTAYDGPWFVQALSIIGAWIASIFLLVWVVALTGFKAPGFIFWGLVLSGGVVAARPSSRGLFVGQMALATAVCGELMLAYGFGDASRSLAVATVGSAIVAAALYALYPDSGARFLSPLIPYGLAVATVFQHRGQESWLHGVVLVLVAIAAVAYVGPPRPALRPLGLAALFSLAATLMMLQYSATVWPSAVVLTLALAGLHAALTPAQPLLARIPLWGAIAALGALSTPGVLFGIALVALGLARSDRLLGGLGCLFLTVFISWFYYQLDIDLATKSCILIASGGVLLLVRATLPRLSEAP